MVDLELWGRILPVPLLVCSQRAIGGLGEAGSGTGGMLGLSGPGSCADTRDVWAVARARVRPGMQEPAVGNGEGASPVAFCSFWCL